MKKEFRIGLIVVLAVVVIALIVSNVNPTGNATFTPRANYGPVQQHFSVYTECAYVDTDDGWDVTTKSTVSYFNKLLGTYETVEDFCGDGLGSVIEHHCEDGYMKTRTVGCPSNQYCNQGVCVLG